MGRLRKCIILSREMYINHRRLSAHHLGFVAPARTLVCNGNWHMRFAKKGYPKRSTAHFTIVRRLEV